MNEVWKDIPGFDGYQASNLGRIRSIDRLKIQKNGRKRVFPGKLMKPFIDQWGYLRIALNAKRKQKVHRLVALTFIPNPDNKPCVNHIDSDRANARAENLEWVTAKENVRHAKKAGRWHEQSRGFENKRSKAVIAINTSTGEKMIFGSQKDAARQLGLHQTHVCDVVNGKAKTTGGYKFFSSI